MSSSPILMIPGPTEFADDVLAAMGSKTDSHVAPSFIESFGNCIELTRKLMLSKDAQPFIIAGSGSLGWDMMVANLTERGQKALVVHTGYFSDSFATCLEAYGVEVQHVKATPGDVVGLEAIRAALQQDTFALVALTQVDTSTGVLNDIKGISALVHEVSPDTLVTVDGVCSFMAEEFRFDDWGIDAAMTGSQKAVGVPPGLMLLTVSQRALARLDTRSTPVPAYYASMKHWLPIMKAYEARKPSYFATPAVNLIKALQVALKTLDGYGMEHVFQRHKTVAESFRSSLNAMGLTLLPTSADRTAHTMSAIKYPAGVAASDLLPKIKASGVIVAGGLHKDVKHTYFRVGHMGVSVLENKRTDLLRTLKAVEKALRECGQDVAEGTAEKTFNA